MTQQVAARQTRGDRKGCSASHLIEFVISVAAIFRSDAHPLRLPTLNSMPDTCTTTQRYPAEHVFFGPTEMPQMNDVYSRLITQYRKGHQTVRYRSSVADSRRNFVLFSPETGFAEYNCAVTVSRRRDVTCYAGRGYSGISMVP